MQLTWKEIERMSTKKMLAQHFGDLSRIFELSPKAKGDAELFVREYQAKFSCDLCQKKACRPCQQLYAFFISRYWLARDQAKEIYRVLTVGSEGLLVFFLSSPWLRWRSF
jgi:hypothetical protein